MRPRRKHITLLYLVAKTGLRVPRELFDFLSLLNGVSVPTRYPDDTQTLLKDYTERRTKELLAKAGEGLQWLKGQL